MRLLINKELFPISNCMILNNKIKFYIASDYIYKKYPGLFRVPFSIRSLKEQNAITKKCGPFKGIIAGDSEDGLIINNIEFIGSFYV